MGRRLLWTVTLLPLAVALAVWVASRTGALTDDRIEIRLSALRGDWFLAAGLLLSALAGGFLVVAERRDARWRARFAEQAAESTRERHLLMSRLDHELKNPLTAMRAALANVTAGAPGQERATGLSSIETQVLRLSRLTADLRKIADVESSELDRRPLEVAPLLEEAVEVAGEQPAAADRVLTLDLPRAPWPLPQVSGDGNLLTLAFANLVDNAIKFTGPGGRIEVRAREAAGRVVVEVADTGPGIGADELPYIWDELYRGPRGRAVPGSGLGLALVRAVVERHGGSVGVESRLGQGTLVRLELPGEPRDGTRPTAAVAAQPGVSRQNAADPAT